FFTVDSDFFRGFDFAPYIDFGGWIVADQDDGQTRPNPGRDHGFDFRSDLTADVLRDFASVQDGRGHSGSEEILSQLPRTSPPRRTVARRIKKQCVFSGLPCLNGKNVRVPSLRFPAYVVQCPSYA